jgi:hypothetical protein
VNRFARLALYFVLFFLLGQARHAIPVEATTEVSLGLDITVPGGSVSLGGEKTITIDVLNDGSPS